MKKLLTVLFAGALMLAIAAPAMASHAVWVGPEPNYTFAVGGQLEIDGWYGSKLPSFPDDNLRYYNQESRLFFKGTWGEVEGQIRLEWDYDWDTANQNKGATSQNTLDLAWLKFPIPGTPLKITAGLQPLLFGKSILIDTGGQYMLLATLPIDKMSFTAGTIKFTETYLDNEDRDAYLLLFNTTAIPNNAITALVYYENNKVTEGKPWDVGVFVEGNAAMLKYWVEGHLQNGTIAEDIDLRAYALAGGIATSVGAADLTLWASYASGDKDVDDTYKAFFPIAPNFGEDVDVVMYNITGGNVSNAWVLGLRGDVKPMPNFSAFGMISFWNAVQDSRVDGEKYLGTEFDLSGTYKINDYLNWTLRFGYLVSGDGLALDYDENPFILNNEFKVLF